MQQYIDNGRSTPGVPQKNDVAVQLPGGGKGGEVGKMKKQKRSKQD